MTLSPLIDAAALHAALQEPLAPLVLDVSFDLQDESAGQIAFDAHHIPGSIYVHLDRDLCGAKWPERPKTESKPADSAPVFAGRHPLPTPAAFRQKLKDLGWTPERSVVVLDRNQSMYAARLWWMFHWIGHTQVQVLDGGLAAWTRNEAPAQAQADERPDAYPGEGATSGARTIDAAEILEKLGQVTVVDARAWPRYSGQIEPLDAVAGHIPGARHRCFLDNLQADGRFKDPSDLHREWSSVLAGADPASTVHQCGSGVTACHNLLATVAAGLPMGLLYPGSWSQWCHLPERPVARGG